MEFLKKLMLVLLKLSPRPESPDPSPESKVFRAATGYFHYRVFLWSIRQTAAFIISMIFLSGLIIGAVASLKGNPSPVSFIANLLIFAFAFISLVIEIIFSFLVLWMDYEMRWYEVGDRSLRIREGALNVREMTLTFANIQNVSVTQGPLQKLLGIADIKIETAGGGGKRLLPSGNAREKGVIHMHEACFRGITMHEEIKNLIVAKLKKYKNAGLGEKIEEDYSPRLRPSKKEILNEIKNEFAIFAKMAAELK
jgi:membrane protein YdbS with pleckstrin-like domain